jgi:hypothetical protein
MRFRFVFDVRWTMPHIDGGVIEYGRRFVRLITAATVTDAYDRFAASRRKRVACIMRSITDTAGKEYWNAQAKCVMGYQRKCVYDRMVKAALAGEVEIITLKKPQQSAVTKRPLLHCVDLGAGVYVRPEDIAQVEVERMRLDGSIIPYMTLDEIRGYFFRNPSAAVYAYMPDVFEIVGDWQDANTVMGFTSGETWRALIEQGLVAPNQYDGSERHRGIYPAKGFAETRSVLPRAVANRKVDQLAARMPSVLMLGARPVEPVAAELAAVGGVA